MVYHHSIVKGGQKEMDDGEPERERIRRKSRWSLLRKGRGEKSSSCWENESFDMYVGL